MSMLRFALFLFFIACNSYADSGVNGSKVQDGSSYNSKPAQYQFTFTADKFMDSYAMSDNMLSAVEAYKVLDDQTFGRWNKGRYSTTSKFASFVTRYIASNAAFVYVHESGHAFRNRENGYSNPKIVCDDFLCQGAVTWSGNYSGSDPYVQGRTQFSMINTAGVQATYVMSEKQRNRMLEQKKITPVYASSYFWSRFSQFQYTTLSSDFSNLSNNIAGNDMVEYAKNYKFFYGGDITQQMQPYSYIDLMDPFLFYSAYSMAFDKEFSIPMINITENVKYLPGARLSLTPFGFEPKLVNHFNINDKYLQVQLGYGDNFGIQSQTLWIKTDRMLQTEKFSFDFDVAVWNQPDFVDKLVGENKTMKVGGLGGVQAKYRATGNLGLNIYAGYKTSGFIEGFYADSSPLIRVGFTYFH